MILKHSARTFFLLIIEGALIYSCGLAAIYLRFDTEFPTVFGAEGGWLKTLLVMCVVQGAFYLFELYDFRLIRRQPALLIRICQALGLAAIALGLLFYALPWIRLGRGVFLVGLLLMLTLMTSWRWGARWLLGNTRLAERILILGVEPGAVAIAREMIARREKGYEVLGFVGDDPSLVGKSLINPCVIGTMLDLEELVRHHRADRIVVAMADRRGQLPLDLLLKLKIRDNVAVEESDSFYERLTGKISTERLRPGQLIFSESSRWTGFYKRTRRLVDIAMACTGLVLGLPLMIVAAIAIKLESRGPVIYTQERVGLHNTTFTIFKFRSMCADAEAGGPAWADEADSRVTRTGRLIRKMRIDELPQLVNVIRGEMGMIGPRPERPVFVQQLETSIPYYSERHLVKPGLSGWAQVCHPYGASLEDAREKHQYDLYYIKNQSPMLDAIILLETVRVVLFGRFSR